MSKIFRNFPKPLWVKCFRCDKKIQYVKLIYVVRIPEQLKYAGVCEGCYNKRKGNAQPIEEIRKSEFNHDKLKYDKLLKLP